MKKESKFESLVWYTLFILSYIAFIYVMWCRPFPESPGIKEICYDLWYVDKAFAPDELLPSATSAEEARLLAGSRPIYSERKCDDI